MAEVISEEKLREELEREADTNPKMLMRNYLRYGDTITAMRKKDFRVWNSYTWKDCYEHTKYASLG